MTAVTVFLRNLTVILAVGGVGYGLLRLPYHPLLIGGGYAALLAILMTWSELSSGKAPQPRAGAPRGPSSKPGRRPAREKGEASGAAAVTSEGSPAAQNASVPSPKKRATSAARPGTPPRPGADRARQ
jgi:hypothetical protein